MAGASVEIKRFLEWAETDAAGHQHYSSAFRWVEECEAALYRSVGLPSTLFGQIPRVKVAMEYKREPNLHRVGLRAVQELASHQVQKSFGLQCLTRNLEHHFVI